MDIKNTKDKVHKKILIVGLPNTGKSHIFSNLTGKYALSGNYSYTTIDVDSHTCRIDDEVYEVIDTPPMHCLYSHSEEELDVREIILNEKPEVILQCIDANKLKQSLTLTIDLLELGLPMVITLNAVDETAKQGVWIDTNKLSELLGIKVIESVATKGIGIDSIKKAISKAKRSVFDGKYGDIIEKRIEAVVKDLPADMPANRKIALLVLQGDEYIKRYLERIIDETALASIAQIKKSVKSDGINVSRYINSKKCKWIDDIVEQCVGRHHIRLDGNSELAAKLSRHPVFGFVILSAVLSIMIFSVVNVANFVAGWMHNALWMPIEHRVGDIVTNELWKSFLIGDYGVLTFGVANALLTVLPILSVFFLLFNMLEDSGYIPNLCVLMKRVTEKIGLTGNSVMPVTLAFGCKTMATLNTKTIRSKKEKFIAVYLIAFGIPCAAQMGLNMSILGRLGFKSFFITFGFLGILWLCVGMMLNKILKEDAKDFFLFELPKMRFPHMGSVIKKTAYKLKDFLKEAMPIFVSAAVFLFFADKIGVLQGLKNILEPVITGFLGFPIQMVDVLILCMAKHEAAAGMLIKLIERGYMNPVQIIVAVTLTMMFVPCLANIMAMIRVEGIKKALSMVLAINVTAIIMAGFLNWLLLTFKFY
ncbi:MAG: ferrous iron transporter B [Candidatus Omnitrophica bacterium]|nr:ferrous iron transporter B [Candidatus Omnitrophota bacterium]